MNKFRLDGVVGVDFDASFVAEKLGDSGDVEITLNSPGGDVIEGMADIGSDLLSEIML